MGSRSGAPSPTGRSSTRGFRVLRCRSSPASCCRRGSSPWPMSCESLEPTSPSPGALDHDRDDGGEDTVARLRLLVGDGLVEILERARGIVELERPEHAPDE